MSDFIYTDLFMLVLVTAFALSVLYLVFLFLQQLIADRRERKMVEDCISTLNLEVWDDEDDSTTLD